MLLREYKPSGTSEMELFAKQSTFNCLNSEITAGISLRFEFVIFNFVRFVRFHNSEGIAQFLEVSPKESSLRLDILPISLLIVSRGLPSICRTSRLLHEVISVPKEVRRFLFK